MLDKVLQKNNHPMSSYGEYLGESDEKRAGAGGAEVVSKGPTLTTVNHFKWLTLLWMRGAWMTRHGWKCKVPVYMLVRSSGVRGYHKIKENL